jgi:ABC-type bacteriocin/lantibiotic exporter with double-glycine peptidase domain
MPAPLLNVPHSQQQAEFACVPACVKMVLAFYGVEVSEEDLTRLMETDWEGTIPDHITRVSSFGMLATVYHAEMSDVQRYLESGVPCIAFVSTVYFNY